MLDAIIKQNKALCESREPIGIREVLTQSAFQFESKDSRTRTVSEKLSDGRTLYTAKVSHAGRVNQNARLYSKELWQQNIERMKPLMAQGKVKGAVDHLGELEGGNLKSSPVIWRELWMETDGGVFGKYEIVENHSAGADLKALKDAGSALGWSTYGFGTGHHPTEDECMKYGIHEDDADNYAIMDMNYSCAKIDSVDQPSEGSAWDIPAEDMPPLTGAPGDPALHMVGSPQSGDPMAPTGASLPVGGFSAYSAASTQNDPASRLSEKEMKAELYESANSIHLNHAAVGHAMSCVSSGKIDHGSFSGDSTERSSANSNKFLGVDTSFSPDEKGHWKFPIFTGDKVSAKGVATAAHYSDGTYPEIHAACTRISDEIKRKSDEGDAKGDSIDSPSRLSERIEHQSNEELTMKTVAELKEKAPELYAEVLAAGKAEALTGTSKVVEAFNALLASPEFIKLEGVKLPEREVAPKEFTEQVEALKAESAAKDAKLAEHAARIAEFEKKEAAAKAEQAKVDRLKAIEVKAVELTKENVFADVLKADVAEAAEKPEFKVEDVEALIKKLTEKYNKLAPAKDRQPQGQNLTEEEVSELEEAELGSAVSEGMDYSNVKPLNVKL